MKINENVFTTKYCLIIKQINGKKVIQMINLLTLLKGIRQTILTHVVVLARMEAATSVCSNMYILEMHKFSLKFETQKS